MSIEKIRVESQPELEQMITKEIGQIEKDLTVICDNVQINDKTTLDVLCHDDNGQLVVLQLSVSEDDVMLLHGIQSLDYVNKFKSFLKATYSKHKIDDQESPRLILVAPRFSDALRRAVESMKGMRIDLYEWEYLKLGDHKGLRLQPIFTWTPREKPKDEKEPKLPERKSESKHEPKSNRKKEQTPTPEYKEQTPLEPKEEQTPPPPEFESNPPEEKFPDFPTPPEEKPDKSEEDEKSIFKPKDEEPPKRKLKLF